MLTPNPRRGSQPNQRGHSHSHRESTPTADSGTPTPHGSGDAADGAATPDTNRWLQAMAANPGHSRWYAERWVKIQATGRDIFGEARLADAMAPRQADILDLGSGTGRVGGYLARAGHRVVGVDLDPYLVNVARRDWPEAEWIVGNIATASLTDASGNPRLFDLAISSGNVFTFLARSERRPALRNLALHLKPNGVGLVGFGAGRGYAFSDFFDDAAAAGLAPRFRFGTWQLGAPGDDFLVAVLVRA